VVIVVCKDQQQQQQQQQSLPWVGGGLHNTDLAPMTMQPAVAVAAVQQ
jgi:hypothetical protein